MLVSLSSTTPGVARLLGQPEKPRQLPRGRANPGVPHPLRGHPDEHAHHQRPDAGARRPANDRRREPRRPPPTAEQPGEPRRTVSPANVNHYNVQPVYDVFANVQGRDLAAVAADVQKAIDAVRPDCRPGSTIVIRGQVQTMNSSFTGLATGLGFRCCWSTS